MDDHFEIKAVDVLGTISKIGDVVEFESGIKVSLDDGQYQISLNRSQDFIPFLQQYITVNAKHQDCYPPFLVPKNPDHVLLLEKDQAWDMHLAICGTNINIGRFCCLGEFGRRSDLFTFCWEFAIQAKTYIKKNEACRYTFYLVVDHISVYTVYIYIEEDEKPAHPGDMYSVHYLNVKTLKDTTEIDLAINKIVTQIYVDLCNKLVPMLNV